MINVSYLSQRDNFNLDGTKNESNECMISSFAMVLNWIAQKYFIPTLVMSEYEYLHIISTSSLKEGKEDRFWMALHRRIGNNLFSVLKLPLEFYEAIASYDTIVERLKAGFPVVVGTDISLFLPNATGHIIVAIDYDELGIYFHDPYGNALTGYKDPNGKRVYYTKKHLKSLLNNTKCSPLRIPV